MPVKPERIEVFNINTPGTSSFVQKYKYDEVKKVMQAHMPTQAPGMTQDELAELVIAHVSNAIFPDRTKAGWWMKTVQLDLEARQVLIREKARPLRWHYDPSRKETVPEASQPRAAT